MPNETTLQYLQTFKGEISAVLEIDQEIRISGKKR